MIETVNDLFWRITIADGRVDDLCETLCLVKRRLEPHSVYSAERDRLVRIYTSIRNAVWTEGRRAFSVWEAADLAALIEVCRGEGVSFSAGLEPWMQRAAERLTSALHDVVTKIAALDRGVIAVDL